MRPKYLRMQAHNQIIMRRRKNHTHKSVDMWHRLWYNCPRQNYGAAILDRRKAGHEVLLPLFYLKHLVGMSNLLACGAHTFVSRIEWPLRCGSRRNLLPKERKGGCGKHPVAELPKQSLLTGTHKANYPRRLIGKVGYISLTHCCAIQLRHEEAISVEPLEGCFSYYPWIAFAIITITMVPSGIQC